MRVYIKIIVGMGGALLIGCTTVPPATPPSAFSQCMSQLGYKFHYTGDMIRAADWCKANNNGN